jgi:hypothetical protein
VGYPFYYLKVGAIYLYFLKNIHTNISCISNAPKKFLIMFFLFKLLLGGDQKLTQVSIEYHSNIEHWTPRVQDLLIPKLIPRPLGIYCVKINYDIWTLFNIINCWYLRWGEKLQTMSSS